MSYEKFGWKLYVLFDSKWLNLNVRLIGLNPTIVVVYHRHKKALQQVIVKYYSNKECLYYAIYFSF